MGLDSTGLGWAGLGWTGLAWAAWAGLGWAGLRRDTSLNARPTAAWPSLALLTPTPEAWHNPSSPHALSPHCCQLPHLADSLTVVRRLL